MRSQMLGFVRLLIGYGMVKTLLEDFFIIYDYALINQ